MKSAFEPLLDFSGVLHGLWAATRFQQKHNMTNSYGTSHMGVIGNPESSGTRPCWTTQLEHLGQKFFMDDMKGYN